MTFASEAERARCLETLAGMRRHLDDAGGLLPDLRWFQKRLQKLARAIDRLSRDAR